MLSHGVRRNLPKRLAAPQSGLFLLRLGPGGSGGLPERTARLGTRHELRDLPCPTRGGYFLATLFPMRVPIASRGRWRALSRCDGWRFQTLEADAGHRLLWHSSRGPPSRLSWPAHRVSADPPDREPPSREASFS